jgi:ERCC4-related helicase
MRGKVIVLLAEGTVDEAYFYSSLRRERFMKSMVSPNRAEKKPKPTKPTTLLDYVE